MKKIIFLLLYVVFLCTSCKKFLEEKTDGLVTSDQFYQTDADVIAAVNGIYQGMRADVNEGQMYPISTVEIMSDDATPGGTVTTERFTLDDMTYNARHAYIQRTWAGAYRVINRANSLLFYTTNTSKIADRILRRTKAEAQFFRAFYYFRLVQLFGDVPLVLEPADVTKSNLQPPRSASRDVYKQILDDLQYAEVNLDTTYAYTSTNGGRVTQAAAKALMGKVYLTMAGFPLKDISKYQLAADKLKELMDKKDTYKLDVNPNYANIFSADETVKAADKERIFYIKGASGFPASLQAYTRMKSNYRASTLINASTDYVPFLFSAGTTTYNNLTGGTTVPSVQADDAISAALPIGFSYNFGGTRYDKFYMSSNGFISFISRSNLASSLNAVKDPIIGPLMDNLNGTGGVASYATSGTAPNRVLTVEWRNWRWKTGTTVANNISFQVKLYEADGKIEMLYNQISDPVNAPATAVGFRVSPFYCSIRNTATAPDFNWDFSISTYSTNITRFQPGQIFTIIPSGVFEWVDTRRLVSINSAYGVTKYNDQINTGYTDNADDFHWLRYSDVLLMYAEALIEMGGTANMDIALEQINLVRRAHGGTSGTPAVPMLSDLSYTDQNDLREKLRLERRREFTFEAQRWYDLKRWEIMPEKLRKQLSTQYNQPISNYDYITKNVMFWPIPNSERTNNPNLSQNDGY